jgi:hypothetical protein
MEMMRWTSGRRSGVGASTRGATAGLGDLPDQGSPGQGDHPDPASMAGLEEQVGLSEWRPSRGTKSRPSRVTDGQPTLGNEVPAQPGDRRSAHARAEQAGPAGMRLRPTRMRESGPAGAEQAGLPGMRLLMPARSWLFWPSLPYSGLDPCNLAQTLICRPR